MCVLYNKVIGTEKQQLVKTVVCLVVWKQLASSGLLNPCCI